MFYSSPNQKKKKKKKKLHEKEGLARYENSCSRVKLRRDMIIRLYISTIILTVRPFNHNLLISC